MKHRICGSLCLSTTTDNIGCHRIPSKNIGSDAHGYPYFTQFAKKVHSSFNIWSQTLLYFCYQCYLEVGCCPASDQNCAQQSEKLPNVGCGYSINMVWISPYRKPINIYSTFTEDRCCHFTMSITHPPVPYFTS